MYISFVVSSPSCYHYNIGTICNTAITMPSNAIKVSVNAFVQNIALLRGSSRQTHRKRIYYTGCANLAIVSGASFVCRNTTLLFIC